MLKKNGEKKGSKCPHSQPSSFRTNMKSLLSEMKDKNFKLMREKSGKEFQAYVKNECERMCSLHANDFGATAGKKGLRKHNHNVDFNFNHSVISSFIAAKRILKNLGISIIPTRMCFPSSIKISCCCRCVYGYQG